MNPSIGSESDTRIRRVIPAHSFHTKISSQHDLTMRIIAEHLKERDKGDPAGDAEDPEGE